MAVIILRKNFSYKYQITTENSYEEFGKLCAKRFDDNLRRIADRLSRHPLSSPQEPLLKDVTPYSYRSANIMKNWKIIYRYDEKNNKVFFVDLWDMRRNPKTLVRIFKRIR